MNIEAAKRLKVGDRFRYFTSVWEVKEIQERGLVAVLYCPGTKGHGSHKSFVEWSEMHRFDEMQKA